MPSLRRPGPFLRFAITIAFALMASFTAVLTTPRPVAACSCAAFETLKQAATPETAIFTGTAGPRDARGVPVDVQSWFWGTGAAPVVWLAGDSFGDGDSCGVEPPPAGSSWLWVGWALEPLLPDHGGGLVGRRCSWAPVGPRHSAMTEKDLARKLPAGLHQMPNATPSEALAEFRRQLIETGLTRPPKVKGGGA